MFTIYNQELSEWASTRTDKFHAVLCDPPYGLTSGEGAPKGFMGKEWDARVDAKVWGEAIKPLLYEGAIVLMFAGPRTQHKLAIGMEDAGFECFNQLLYLYGKGFPKTQDIGKLIDKKLGVFDQREVVGKYQPPGMDKPWNLTKAQDERSVEMFSSSRNNLEITAPASPEAKLWDGWKNTALKPAYEPILAFKLPTAKTYADLALGDGAGCLNIGGVKQGGRFPANVILDEDSAKMLDAETSQASRFFYTIKPTTKEREAGLEGMHPQVTDDGRKTAADNPYQRGKTLRRNNHPCVKPIDLCRWLATLILPPPHVHSRLLVPFSGTGSEMIGALQAGWKEVVGVEMDSHYVDIAERRIAHWMKP